MKGQSEQLNIDTDAEIALASFPYLEQLLTLPRHSPKGSFIDPSFAALTTECPPVQIFHSFGNSALRYDLPSTAYEVSYNAFRRDSFRAVKQI